MNHHPAYGTAEYDQWKAKQGGLCFEDRERRANWCLTHNSYWSANGLSCQKYEQGALPERRKVAR